MVGDECQMHCPICPDISTHRDRWSLREGSQDNTRVLNRFCSNFGIIWRNCSHFPIRFAFWKISCFLLWSLMECWCEDFKVVLSGLLGRSHVAPAIQWPCWKLGTSQIYLVLLEVSPFSRFLHCWVLWSCEMTGILFGSALPRFKCASGVAWLNAITSEIQPPLAPCTLPLRHVSIAHPAQGPFMRPLKRRGTTRCCSFRHHFHQWCRQC